MRTGVTRAKLRAQKTVLTEELDECAGFVGNVAKTGER
jgi:hypothetical protein